MFYRRPCGLGQTQVFRKTGKRLKSIAFCVGPYRSVTSRNARFEGPKMRSPLYFTGANAISERREINQEKMRWALSIAFHRHKCDRGKAKSGILDSKRKCVKTLGPTHENDVSHVEGAQRGSENSKFNLEIHAKLMVRVSKSAKTLKHSLKIIRKAGPPQIQLLTGGFGRPPQEQHFSTLLNLY